MVRNPRPVRPNRHSPHESWFRAKTTGVLVSLLVHAVLTVAPAATAAVIVYPARIQTEVPAAGIVKEIVLENRGAFPIEARLSIGTGTHGVDGAPLFRDGAEHQTAGERFVRLGTDTLIVPPGEHRSFEVGLRSTPGAVAAYPVIFVEVH